jgi:hypothetical protein
MIYTMDPRPENDASMATIRIQGTELFTDDTKDGSKTVLLSGLSPSHFYQILYRPAQATTLPTAKP